MKNLLYLPPFLMLILNVNAQTSKRNSSDSVYWKVVDSQIFADGLIYRFKEVNLESSNEFLEQSMKLNFSQLKHQVDKTNSKHIDEDIYEHLFIKFPEKFNDYLEQYLIPQINKTIERSKKSRDRSEIKNALAAAETSINLINASLLVCPHHVELTALKKTTQKLMNEIKQKQEQQVGSRIP